MLQTHLENFKSEHPIIAVSLQAHPIKPNSQQFGLFETTLRNPNQLSETLARLTALLGVDRVGTPVLDETHRPDAFHIEPFAWHFSNQPTVEAAVPGGSASHTLRTAHTTIALRRFRPAVSTSVFLSENIPAHLRSANPFGCRPGQANGKVAEQRGPYLASGNWWDEKAWARAEWDLQLENGALLRCHQSRERWAADGIYD
jgi:protein ImuB